MTQMLKITKKLVPRSAGGIKNDLELRITIWPRVLKCNEYVFISLKSFSPHNYVKIQNILTIAKETGPISAPQFGTAKRRSNHKI